MENNKQPSAYSLEAFADELQVSKRLVWGWVDAGRIRAVTLNQGKRKTLRRIPRSELDRVLAEGLT